MTFDPNSLREALATLGELLEDRGHPFELVVIGGGALLLGGLMARPTKDLDVVARVESQGWVRAEPMPAPLARAVADVAVALDLPDDWLNPGPTDLLDFGLPEGFADRAVVQQFSALTLRIAARIDQIAFKLYAAADRWPDRSKHLQDLRGLNPTADELRAAARWCLTHDTSDGFRTILLAPVLQTFDVELPDG